MPIGLLGAVLAVLLLSARSTEPGPRAGSTGPRPEDKIQFDLSALNDAGLFGPADGLRALHYEFCIPATEAHVDEVRTIDPSIEVMRRSPGRIGCTSEQYLCVGSTHQPGFRDVLTRLASLSYVERIEPSFAE